MNPAWESRGDRWFAIPLSQYPPRDQTTPFHFFWELYLPKLEHRWNSGIHKARGCTSFPFGREETEAEMSAFKDPYGGILRTERVMFKRCGCVDSDGKRRVCVPPVVGYMCSRKALLVKRDIVLERERVERERKRRENASIEENIKGSERAARAFTESDDGKIFCYFPSLGWSD